MGSPAGPCAAPPRPQRAYVVASRRPRRRLATEALTRGSRDNITVVVAFLRPVETLEKIYGEGKQKYVITPTLYGSRAEMMARYSHGNAAELQDSW
jgi:hypothetical protein